MKKSALTLTDLIVLRDCLNVHMTPGVQQCHNNRAGVNVARALQRKLQDEIAERHAEIDRSTGNYFSTDF